MNGMFEIGILEFVELFNDENACRKYLFSKRFPNEFICPRCECNSYCLHTTRNLYQCSKCKYQCSVTAGTIMHKSQTPLRKWFMAMYLITKDKRGCSAMQLMRELKLTYKCAWLLLQKLRSAMGEIDNENTLSGIVEVDDAYIGGKKKGGKRGRGTKKTKIIAAVSKTDTGKPQKLKIKIVSNLKSKTIKKFASDYIDESSQIQTDSFHSYRKLSVEKFAHEYKIFNPDSDWLKWLHIIISNAKSFVGGTFHGLREKHLQRYLDEFCYRFNRRKIGSFIFDCLAFDVMHVKPLSYAEIKG